MASVGYRIRSRAKRQVPIYVYVYLEKGFRQEVKCGLWVDPDKWDSEAQCAEGNDPLSVAINEGLNHLRDYLWRVINDTSLVSDELEAGWLDFHVRTCFDLPTLTKENTLLYNIELYIERAPMKRVKRTGAIGLSSNSVRNLQGFYELVSSFETHLGKPIYLSKIDEKLVFEFQQWLLEDRGYSLNSTGLQLKLLKMVCKQAERLGAKVHDYTKHIEVVSQSSRDRILQTLSFKEIDKIRNLNKLPVSLENARRWMLIGLFIGQRVSDLLKLKPYQVRPASNGVYIDIYQQKSQKRVTVGVIDKTVLYILKEEFPYEITSQQFNQQIKIICKLAGITEMVQGYKRSKETKRTELGTFPKYSLISSHDLRRSFATNYFGVIETPILMQITGHSKESTFLSYIGQEPNKDVYADAFMRSVLKLAGSR